MKPTHNRTPETPRHERADETLLKETESLLDQFSSEYRGGEPLPLTERAKHLARLYILVPKVARLLSAHADTYRVLRTVHNCYFCDDAVLDGIVVRCIVDMIPILQEVAVRYTPVLDITMALAFYVDDKESVEMLDQSSPSSQMKKLIRKLLPEFVEHYKHFNLHLTHPQLHSVRMTMLPFIYNELEELNDTMHEEEKGSLEGLINNFSEYVAHIVLSDLYHPYKIQVRTYSDPFELRRAKRSLTRFVHDKEKSIISQNDIMTAIRGFDNHAVQMKVFEKIFWEFGLRVNDYRDLLFTSNSKHNFAYTAELLRRVFLELNTIHLLEKQRKGAVGHLRHKYGIVWFGRYSLKQLVDQYDQTDDKKPSIIIVSSRTDYSDSLSSIKEKEIVDSIAQQGKALKCNVRCIEAGSVPELLVIIERLQAQYAGSRYIRCVVVRGHGDSTGFTLGRLSPYGDFVIDTVEDPAFDIVKACLEENAVWVLDGCSVGRGTNNFAKKLSEVCESTVYAPKGLESALDALELQDTQGSLTVKAHYTNFSKVRANKGTNGKGPKYDTFHQPTRENVYKRGRKV
jgi:hypothetical protein